MINVHDLVDYIIIKLDDLSISLNHLKLQKLLYYTQAWFLAFNEKPLLEEKFESWSHGPILTDIYNRFKSRGMYDPIIRGDVINDEVENYLHKDITDHINSVIETYASFSSTQLETLIRRELPYQETRIGIKNDKNSNQVISENTMKDFYIQVYQRGYSI